MGDDIRPDPDIVRRFIWEPIGDLGNPPVFAFGAPWMRMLKALDVATIATLGVGRVLAYGSFSPTRCVVVARTPTGGTVIVEKHRGSAGPPSQVEAIRLRDCVHDMVGR